MPMVVKVELIQSISMCGWASFLPGPRWRLSGTAAMRFSAVNLIELPFDILVTAVSVLCNHHPPT